MRDVLFGLLMALGLVGVIVPVLPGLVLIAGVAVVWAFAEGSGTAWAVVAAMIVILAVGTYLKFRIPGRALKAQMVPRRTWWLVATGGIVGFFVVPVVGAVIGVVLGAYIGERIRFGEHRAAWDSATQLLRGIGKGMALEFAAGVLALVLWVIAVIAI